MSLASVSYREVQSIVESWTKKYQYHISLLETNPNQVKFMVEFSLPQAQQPIPVATVRVYFTCTHSDMTFRFQKDSLIHSPRKTIRHQQIQQWIDDALSKKMLVRQTVFYLGTAYQRTRVHDPRQDKILKETIIPPEIQEVWIHPDLLADQIRFIEIMEKPGPDIEAVQKQLKQHFRQVDQENIGVITHAEYMTLIKNVGVKLTPQQQKDLLKRMDPEQTGTIQYAMYQQVSGQFFEGLEAKRASEVRLALNHEEELFSSILVLINDESQDIEELIIQKFKAKDEDQTGVTNISELKVVLDQINKKFKDQNKSQPLNVVELADITKIVTDVYGYKQIPYNKIHRHIIEYKISQLTIGRVNSRLNSLETHLQEIFSKHDEKKNGKIRLQALEESLKRSEKIQLSRAQVYLLKSLLPVDKKEEVSYTQNAKFLAQFIKRLYLGSSKKKE